MRIIIALFLSLVSLAESRAFAGQVWASWPTGAAGYVAAGVRQDDGGSLVVLCDSTKKRLRLGLMEPRANWQRGQQMKFITRIDTGGDANNTIGRVTERDQLVVPPEDTSLHLNVMEKATRWFAVATGDYSRVFPVAGFRKAVEPVLQACGGSLVRGSKASAGVGDACPAAVPVRTHTARVGSAQHCCRCRPSPGLGSNAQLGALRPLAAYRASAIRRLSFGAIGCFDNADTLPTMAKRPMGKKPRQHKPSWAVHHVKGTSAKLVGIVDAPDEQNGHRSRHRGIQGSAERARSTDRAPAAGLSVATPGDAHCNSPEKCP